jgi:hypothetical protein
MNEYNLFCKKKNTCEICNKSYEKSNKLEAILKSPGLNTRKTQINKNRCNLSRINIIL